MAELGHDARVKEIWRYPVKSMAGEEIPFAKVTPKGVLGDRVYALVDKGAIRAATVRTWAAALLSYRSQFLTEPELDAPSPNARITTPDGRVLTNTDPEIAVRLSAAFGRNLALMTTAPLGLLVEFPAGSLGGTLSNTTELPLAGAAPPGTFFDYACVHLIATSTIDHLQAAYPEGRFDVRRFRPNIVVETSTGSRDFTENAWVNHVLAIGDAVRLSIDGPCPRCVMTTLPQGGLPQDVGILRTAAQHNRANVGVYAAVLRGGKIRLGDSVSLCVGLA